MSTPRSSSSSSSSKMPEGKEEKKETPLEIIEALFKEIPYSFHSELVPQKVLGSLKNLPSEYASTFPTWAERLRKLVPGKNPYYKEDEADNRYFLSLSLIYLLNNPKNADTFLNQLERMHLLIAGRFAWQKLRASLLYSILQQPQHADMLLKRAGLLFKKFPKLHRILNYDSLVSLLLTQANNDKITSDLCEAVSIACKETDPSPMLFAILKSGDPNMVSLAKAARNIYIHYDKAYDWHHGSAPRPTRLISEIEAKYPNYAPFYRLSDDINIFLSRTRNDYDYARLKPFTCGILSLMKAGINTEEEKAYLDKCSNVSIRLLPTAPTDDEMSNTNEIIFYLDSKQKLQCTHTDSKYEVVADSRYPYQFISKLSLPEDDLEIIKKLFQKNLPRRIDYQENDINLTPQENAIFQSIFRAARTRIYPPPIGIEVSEVFNYLLLNNAIPSQEVIPSPTKSVLNYLLRSYLVSSEMKYSFATPLLNYFLSDEMPSPPIPTLATSENFQLLCCTASLRPHTLEKVFEQLKESKSLTQERFDEVINAQFNTPFAIMHWLKKTAPALAFDEFAFIPITELRKLKKENRLTIKELHHLISKKIQEATNLPMDLSKLTAAYTTVSPSDKVKKEEVPDEEEKKNPKPS